MDRPPDSMSDRVRHRRFLVLDRHKQSQPQKLDDVSENYSPRSTESSSVSSYRAPFMPMPVAIQVEDEDGFQIRG
ncbi:unnamed protein product [Strongylus vulgaris]|uniref:Uncharacterized protein n=1 Tax=Strongylus vulgaris TaxID=40348 RepID=A0A3P7IEB6_STRVU|nr:unnamed protein product [Strongylus vulgaris]